MTLGDAAVFARGGGFDEGVILGLSQKKKKVQFGAFHWKSTWYHESCNVTLISLFSPHIWRSRLVTSLRRQQVASQHCCCFITLYFFQLSQKYLWPFCDCNVSLALISAGEISKEFRCIFLPSCCSLLHINSILISIPSRYAVQCVASVLWILFSSPSVSPYQSRSHPPKNLSDNFCSPLIDCVSVLLEVCLSNDRWRLKVFLKRACQTFWGIVHLSDSDRIGEAGAEEKVSPGNRWSGVRKKKVTGKALDFRFWYLVDLKPTETLWAELPIHPVDLWSSLSFIIAQFCFYVFCSLVKEK